MSVLSLRTLYKDIESPVPRTSQKLGGSENNSRCRLPKWRRCCFKWHFNQLRGDRIGVGWGRMGRGAGAHILTGHLSCPEGKVARAVAVASVFIMKPSMAGLHSLLRRAIFAHSQNQQQQITLQTVAKAPPLHGSQLRSVHAEIDF